MRPSAEVGLVVGSLGARMERPPGPSWAASGAGKLSSVRHTAAGCTPCSTPPAALLCDHAVTAAAASSDQTPGG